MKYFVVSDIHSFFRPLKDALFMSGYRKTNKEHKLIVIGDVFDRGEETVEVYKYLKTIPKNRIVLIKGNHESLYFDLLKKEFPDDYDFSNGTVKTFCAIAGIPEERLSPSYYFKNGMETQYRNQIRATWGNIRELVCKSEITSWLQSKQWRNYYEIGKYIFTHSFIPVKNNDGLPSYYVEHRKLEPNKYWREADYQDWEDARWGCPWKQYKQGLFKHEESAGKILVCGHWHTDDFWIHLSNIYGSDGAIYYSDHLIAIDGGVSTYYGEGFKRILVHNQNVLVIDEDGIAFDKYGDKLRCCENS